MNDRYEELQHQEAMSEIMARCELQEFRVLGASIGRDGDRWCVLLGSDLMSGVSGWGDTPYHAILAFNRAQHLPSGTFEILSAREPVK